MLTVDCRFRIRAYVGALLLAASLLALAITANPAAAAQAVRHPATIPPLAPGLTAPERLPGLFPGAGYQSQGSSVVRDVQRLLSRAGYDPGPLDGRYGPLTEAAVTRFQIDHGLLADGIAGRQTLAALRASGLVVMPGAGAEPGGSQLVRHLQHLLARAGYRPGPTDGSYGPLTEAAVKRFQTASGLTPDGIIAGAAVAELAAQGRRPGAAASPVRSAPTAVTHHRHAPPAPAIHRHAPPASAIHRHAPPAAAVHRHSRPAPATHSQPRRSPAPVSAPSGVSAHTPGVLGSTPAVRVRPATPGLHVSPPSAPLPLRTIVLVGLGVLALLIAGLPFARRARRARNPRPPQVRGPWTASPVTNDPGPAIAVASAAGEADSAEEADSAFDTGIRLEEEGNLAGAETAYRRADEQGHGAAAVNLGVLLEGNGDITGAEAAYRRADQRGEPNGAFKLGILLESNGDLIGAEAAYRRADERGHAAAAANLGVMLEDRGDRIGAEAAYRRADARGEASGAFNLGLLLEEQGDLAGAASAYERADQPGYGKVAELAHAALLDLGSRAQLAGVGGDGQADGP